MKDFSEPSPLFLNGRQLAGRLGLSVRQVRVLAKEGRIPEITVGRNTRRYDLDAVVAALTHHQINDGMRKTMDVSQGTQGE